MSSPTPEHNLIVARLIGEIDRLRLGLESIPDVDFDLGADRRVRPDLAIFTQEQFSKVELKRLPVVVVPLILVEVVSPSDSASYLRKKQIIYLNAGVAEVWTIYPDEREIEVQTARTVRKFSGDSPVQSETESRITVRIDSLL